jgi:hypothetical protein
MAGRKASEVQRDDSCQLATGLRYAELLAVIAVVAAYSIDGEPTTGPELAALLNKLGDHSGQAAAKWLVTLSRKGWVRVARWRGNTAYYEPTRLALQKCDEWSGRIERAA